MNNIVIIGGGAAGIFAAIGAIDTKIATLVPGTKVAILEKMPRIGTKLSITGGGRCNITHDIENLEELINGYLSGGKFLHSAFSQFGQKETLDFFHSISIDTFADRGKRVFPKCESAPQLTGILENYLRKLGVKIILNCEATAISKDAEKFTIKTKNGQIYNADKIIITTGGLSYPKTGSTGEGFALAKKLEHTVTPLHPSLVPLEVKEPWVKELQGLTLKNVEAKIISVGAESCVRPSKQIAKKFGDILFTHFGLSGPIILYLSRQVVNLISEGEKLKISINLKPALSYEKLDARLKREFAEFPRKHFKNILANFLPHKMIPVFIKLLKIKQDTQCSQIAAEQRNKLLNLLTGFEFTITGDRGFYEAEVTQGGVLLSEVNPKTMESKICPDLFFAGEVLDIDGYIGGFNLQAAFSTGFIAGLNAAKT